MKNEPRRVFLLDFQIMLLLDALEKTCCPCSQHDFCRRGRRIQVLHRYLELYLEEDGLQSELLPEFPAFELTEGDWPPDSYN